MTARPCVLAIALGLLSVAYAEDASRAPKLRALADAYAADGDLAKARRSLEEIAATPTQLLAALRAPARPAAEMTGGLRQLEMQDEHGKTTELLVWAPPTEKLRARTKPLGLAVLLHGLGGSAKNAQPFAEKLIAQGDVVCVAPTATKLPQSDFRDDDGIPDFVRERFKHWWSYDDPRSLVLESVRRARDLFWIDPDRVVLGGVSMGGYGTWNIGLRFPDRFAALAPIAGGVSRYGAKTDKDPYTITLLENGRNTPVYAAHGTIDPLVPFKADREGCEYLESIGGRVQFLGVEVGHTPEALKDALNGPLLDGVLGFMGEAHRTPPGHVKYTALSPLQDGAFWLRILARPEASQPVVDGEVDATHTRLTVTTEGCRKTRVYLDERVLDGGREVEVVANGRRVFKGKIEASFEAVLESWRSRRDPGLVYAAFVDVGPNFR
jgi:poly(3-hydroxybutyrate) depolymerase